MRGKCAVFGCHSASYNKLGYTLAFHRFPLNPERARQWKEACKNPRIKSTKTQMICSLHFEKRMYSNSYLRPDAYPTLKLPKAEFTYRNPEKTFTMSDNSDDSSPEGTDRKISIEMKIYEPNDDGNIELGIDKNVQANKPRQEVQVQPSKIVKIKAESQTGKQIPDSKKYTIKKRRKSVQLGGSYCEDDVAPVSPAASDTNKPANTETQTKCKSFKDPTIECEDLTRHDSDPELQEDSECSCETKGVQASIVPETSAMPSISGVLGTKSSSTIHKTIENNSQKQEEDDCATFVAHLKTRMRNFHPEQKIIAMKLISDVMFMADTRQLQVGSAVVNPEPENDDDDMPLVKKKK